MKPNHLFFMDPGRAAPIVAGLLALAGFPSAHAAVVAGSAAGTALEVDLETLSLLALSVGPAGEAQIASPQVGADSDSVLSLQQTLVLGSVVADNGTDNAITAAATSNVTGVGLSGQTQGTSTVNGLAITVVPGVLLTPDFLTITSDTLGSTTTSSGSFGALGSSGSSVIENLAISVAGVALDIPLNPGPNTVLDLSLTGFATGLTIILNEQVVSGDGTSSTGMITNALRVSLDAVDFGTVTGLSGDIVIGSSEAQLEGVPEPATSAFLTILPAYVWLRRRRRP